MIKAGAQLSQIWECLNDWVSKDTTLREKIDPVTFSKLNIGVLDTLKLNFATTDYNATGYLAVVNVNYHQ